MPVECVPTRPKAFSHRTPYFAKLVATQPYAHMSLARQYLLWSASGVEPEMDFCWSNYFLHPTNRYAQQLNLMTSLFAFRAHVKVLTDIIIHYLLESVKGFGAEYWGLTRGGSVI